MDQGEAQRQAEDEEATQKLGSCNGPAWRGVAMAAPAVEAMLEKPPSVPALSRTSSWNATSADRPANGTTIAAAAHHGRSASWNSSSATTRKTRSLRELSSATPVACGS